MKNKIKSFLELNPHKQLEFLKTGEFPGWPREERIEFLKGILNIELSSKITASALKKLRELGYRDKYFFRRFLYHIDSSVSNAARKAINQKLESNDSECARMKKVLREGDVNDRVLIANCFLDGEGKLDENALISLLSFDDLKVRELIVGKISMEHELDESILSNILKSGASLAWYVRAALVEILGKRKSKYLMEIMDYLINDKNVEVKLKLVDALIKLKEDPADKTRIYMQRLANDSIIWVRREARRALKTL